MRAQVGKYPAAFAEVILDKSDNRVFIVVRAMFGMLAVSRAEARKFFERSIKLIDKAEGIKHLPPARLCSCGSGWCEDKARKCRGCKNGVK